MGKASKATKKFQRNHLDDTLKRRKDHKKAAQKFKSKKPTKKGSDLHGKDEDEDAVNCAPANGTVATVTNGKKERNEDVFQSMSVDDFLTGGFEDAAPKSIKQSKKKTISNKTLDDGGNGSDSVHLGGDASETGEVDLHKSQLGDLAKTDPEFYKFLQQNDAELLNFDNAEDQDLIFSDDDAEDGPETGPVGAEVLTLQTVKKWEKQLSAKSVRALRKVVLGFRAAAHLNEEEGKAYKYSVDNPEVFSRIVQLAITQIPSFLTSYIPIKNNSAGKPKMPTDNKKFVKLIPTLKSHFATLLHFINGLSDPVMQKTVLDSTIALVPYMLTFRKFLRDFIRSTLEVWGTSEAESARVSAFLLVREFVALGDAGLAETSMKTIYAVFVKNARNINTHSLPLINLMKNSASELFGIDVGTSYQLIFGFLRQCAIVLRKAINEKGIDSYKSVYNWQFVNSLDFWSLVLGQHASKPDSSLRPLIYPLVQITLGAARLIPTSQFFPLRFQLLRSLNRLSYMTGVFIPIASILFEVLETAEMKKKPTPSTAKPMNFETAIRAKPEMLRTKTYQDQVGEQVVDILLDYYHVNATSIAFPELSIPAIVQIKRYIKRSKNPKLNRSLAAVVEKLEANGKFIEKNRENVVFTPQNTKQLESFSSALDLEKTPLGAYIKVQRAMKDERRKMIADAEEEADRKGSKSKRRKEEEMDLDESSSEGGEKEGEKEFEVEEAEEEE